MNLAAAAPDLFICQLWRDYLNLSHAAYMELTASPVSDASRAADLPDGLKREVMRSVEIPDPPVLIVSASEEPESRGQRRVISTSFMLRGWLKSSEAGTPQSTLMSTREEISQMVAAACRRCLNGAAFDAWLASLPAERRAGWAVLKTVHGAIAKPVINEAKATLLHGFAVKQWFRMELGEPPP